MRSSPSPSTQALNPPPTPVPTASDWAWIALGLVRFSALARGVWTACTLLLYGFRHDAFYGHFTGARHSSLLLGSSRIAQGLVPHELAPEQLGLHEKPYNFSFSLINSRYGATYRRAIFSKLRPDTDNGLFVLEASPLMVSQSPTARESDDSSFLAQMHWFSATPNLEYPLYQPRRSETTGWQVVRSLLGRSTPMRLHEDGWLEVRPVMSDEHRRRGIDHKVAHYRRTFAENQPSEERIEALRSLLVELSHHGWSVLVRLPVAPELLALQDAYWPGFDERMEHLAHELGLPYINFRELSADVVTNDGNHLRSDWARRVSRLLQQRLTELRDAKPRESL